MTPARFELTIPANERPQTDAVDCVATGTCFLLLTFNNECYIRFLFTLSLICGLYEHRLRNLKLDVVVKDELRRKLKKRQ